MADTVPHNQDELVKRTLLIDKNIDQVVKTLGLDATVATDIKASNALIRTTVQTHNDAVTAEKTTKAERDAAQKTGTSEIRSLIKTVKGAKGYTPAIGLLIGIDESSGNNFDPKVYKPILTTRVMPGRVVIEFVKSELNGVNVYVRLKGTAIWTKLAYDTYSPYEDNRPLAQAGVPEHREYMVIGVIHDVEVTLQSDIVEAVYAG